MLKLKLWLEGEGSFWRIIIDHHRSPREKLWLFDLFARLTGSHCSPILLEDRASHSHKGNQQSWPHRAMDTPWFSKHPACRDKQRVSSNSQIRWNSRINVTFATWHSQRWKNTRMMLLMMRKTSLFTTFLTTFSSIECILFPFEKLHGNAGVLIHRCCIFEATLFINATRNCTNALDTWRHAMLI